MHTKGIGLNGAQTSHYLDHLATICFIMEVPLLVVEASDALLMRTYYPYTQCLYTEYAHLSLEELVASYDVFYRSDLSDRDLFHQKYGLLEQKYRKKVRQVHCPHGFSDKSFYLKECAREDIALIYGQNMLDMLHREGVFKELYSYVVVGNYRYTYFLQNRIFYDTLIEQKVLKKFDQQRPIILYAPTWLDAQHSTSFFDATSHLIKNLPEKYNLIIKLHPRLELDAPAECYALMGKYEGKKNILFLSEFPLVYPLLAHTDIYIGDTSSLGYDFLVFDRPLFFLNQDPTTQNEKNNLLFHCGIEIFPSEYPRIYEIIENSLTTDSLYFKAIRKETYQYTFGQEKSFPTMAAEITSAILHPQPITIK
jgi:hypothetical protein